MTQYYLSYALLTLACASLIASLVFVRIAVVLERISGLRRDGR